MNLKNTCIVALLVLAVFCGISTIRDSSDRTESNTLWVLTEQSSQDGMNLQAKMIAERMEEKYPGLSIQLEVLPTTAEDRERRMTQLRTMIMAGSGPDVYLLPTGGDLIHYRNTERNTISIKPLFSDVRQAMELGVFYDISEWYDVDSDLDKDSLNQSVMNSGILDGARYVLPIRYDIPVIYTRPDLCQKYGLDEDTFQSDVFTMVRKVLAAGGDASVGLQLPEAMETMGKWLDYDRGEITRPVEQIQEYLSLCQKRERISSASTQSFMKKWEYHRRPFVNNSAEDDSDDAFRNSIEYEGLHPSIEEFGHEWLNSLRMYTAQDIHWSSCDLPLYTGWLSDVLETVGVTMNTGQKVVLYPIRTAEGKIQARVTCYGAVGASSRNPELGYAFLREILSEEFQWELNRPRVNKEGEPWTWVTKDIQGQCLIERSLPVRVKGCIPGLWDNQQYRVRRGYHSQIAKTKQRCAVIQQTEITDVPELHWHIDDVYFPAVLASGDDFAAYMEFVKEHADLLTEKDLAELAQEIYQNLWWHLAEG